MWDGEIPKITTVSQLLQIISHPIENRAVFVMSKTGESPVKIKNPEPQYVTTDELHLIIHITEDMLIEDAEQVVDNIRGLVAFLTRK